MNNKGFTVVELLASFVLSMTIVVFLFEIVLELRNIYINESEKTAVINTNSLVATAINDMLSIDSIVNASCTSDSCTVSFVSSPAKTISVNSNDNIVTVDSRKFQYPASSTIETIDLENIGPLNTGIDANNAILKINFEISTLNTEKKIKFHYIYSYKIY